MPVKQPISSPRGAGCLPGTEDEDVAGGLGAHSDQAGQRTFMKLLLITIFHMAPRDLQQFHLKCPQHTAALKPCCRLLTSPLSV